MKVLLLYSGGLDSTVALYSLLNEGHEVEALGFDYGQRHTRELNAALEITLKLGVTFEQQRLDLSFGGSIIGYFRDDETGSFVGVDTVVPGRNLVFLSCALVRALSKGFDAIAIGVTATDAAIYPDCRPAFISSFEGIARRYRAGFRVLRPFIDMEKGAVVELGHRLKVPFAKTWSCYRGNTLPCGECGACVERAHALGSHDNQGMTFARMRKST